MKKAIMLLPPRSRDRIYAPEQIDRICGLVDLTDCAELVGDQGRCARSLRTPKSS